MDIISYSKAAKVENKVKIMNPTATESDVGKALSPKTVNNGEVTEWQYVGEKETHDDVTYEQGSESGYYRYRNGAIEERTSSSFTRSKIAVEYWMQSVSFQILSDSGMDVDSTISCAFTDGNDSFISKNQFRVGSYNIVVPQNAGYIYLSFFGSTYVSPYKIISNAKAKKETQYDGMEGVAFGTSLTYRAITANGYLQYLPDLSGITFDNQGIGSSTILGNGGNLDMLAAIKAYTSYSGKNVCLLEGFVNDWYQNNPLGTWKDTGETTVCGCVRSALNYMLSQNADMTVFLILDPYGRNYGGADCSSTAVNSASLTQKEFYDEIAKVAESLGIPVVKEYAESQISENTPQYLSDNIHPSAFGAEQSANCIWSKMKQFMPNVTAS